MRHSRNTRAAESSPSGHGTRLSHALGVDVLALMLIYIYWTDMRDHGFGTGCKNAVRMWLAIYVHESARAIGILRETKLAMSWGAL